MTSEFSKVLATTIFNDIMAAKNERDFFDAAKYLLPIGIAASFSTAISGLESDLNKFIKTEEGRYSYTENSISIIVLELSNKIGCNKKVDFQSNYLRYCLTSTIIENLKVLRDQWDTAKFIYSLGTLCIPNNSEVVSQIVGEISDSTQRRLAAICARVYVEEYEGVIRTFRPGTEI